MQYRLRTLLIVLALGPPIIAWWGWPVVRKIAWPPTPLIPHHGHRLEMKPLATPVPFIGDLYPTATIVETSGALILDADGYARDSNGRIIFRVD